MTHKEMQRQRGATHRFSLDLKLAKEESGLTFFQLGQKIGLSHNQVKCLIDSPDKMSLNHLRDLCNVLSVPPDNFLVAYGFNLKKEEL